MLLDIFLNFVVFYLGIRKKFVAASIVIAAGFALVILNYNNSGIKADTIIFLFEGVILSIVLLLCIKFKVSPEQMYYYGLLPAFVLVALLVASNHLQDLFKAELLGSIKFQNQALAKISFFKGTSLSTNVLNWLVKLFPAYWMTIALAKIWAIRKVVFMTNKQNVKVMPYRPFVLFKIQDTILWVFIACLIPFVFDNSFFRNVSINVAGFIGVLFFLQGAAVVQCYFAIVKTSKFFIFVFYALAVLTQIPLVVIALVGLLDVKIDFRNKINGTITQNQLRGDVNGNNS